MSRIVRNYSQRVSPTKVGDLYRIRTKVENTYENTVENTVENRYENTVENIVVRMSALRCSL